MTREILTPAVVRDAVAAAINEETSLSVASVATRLGVSRSVVQRDLARYGTCFAGERRVTQLQNALWWLMDTSYDMPIEDAAWTLGLTREHLRVMVVEAVGWSPRRFREVKRLAEMGRWDLVSTDPELVSRLRRVPDVEERWSRSQEAFDALAGIDSIDLRWRRVGELDPRSELLRPWIDHVLREGRGSAASAEVITNVTARIVLRERTRQRGRRSLRTADARPLLDLWPDAEVA